MLYRRQTATALATLALALAACGGGGSADGGTTTATPDGPAATSEPTQATTSEAPATEPVGGGGTAADACELVTADELAGIFGVPSVTTTLLEGPPDTCIVDSADGASLAAWSFTPTGMKAIFESMGGSDLIEVSGIGDKAFYAPGSFQLSVLKGDALVVIASYASAGSDDERFEFAKRIGASAAGRL